MIPAQSNNTDNNLPFLLKSLDGLSNITGFIQVGNMRENVTLYFHEILIYVVPENPQYQGNDLYFQIPWRGIKNLKTSLKKPAEDYLQISIVTRLQKTYLFSFIGKSRNLKKLEFKFKDTVMNCQRPDYFSTFKLGTIFNPEEMKHQGHRLLNVFEDFRMQGLDLADDNPARKYFKVLDNSTYSLCTTYPPLMLAFESLSDKFYQEVSVFRSRERLPLLSAFYKSNHKKIGFVTFWRCSQPLVGLFKNRSFHDEYFMQIIGDPKKKLSFEDYLRAEGKVDLPVDVHVYDMRGKKAAFGNKFKGKGTESTENYSNIRLFFSDIPNIHTVRDSYNSLISILNKNDQESQGDNWTTQVGKTKWMKMQATILRCCTNIVISLKKAFSVVIHCSDGWDRTSQVSALVQLMTIKKYRSIEGFSRLFEKEFVRYFL